MNSRESGPWSDHVAGRRGGGQLPNFLGGVRGQLAGGDLFVAGWQKTARLTPSAPSIALQIYKERELVSCLLVDSPSELRRAVKVVFYI